MTTLASRVREAAQVTCAPLLLGLVYAPLGWLLLARRLELSLARA